MKKFIAALLIFVMLIALTACTSPFEQMKFESQMTKILDKFVDDGSVQSYTIDGFDIYAYTYDEESDKLAHCTDEEIANDVFLTNASSRKELTVFFGKHNFEFDIREAKKNGELDTLPNKMYYAVTSIDKSIVVCDGTIIFK